jgi:hypothetical protein
MSTPAPSLSVTAASDAPSYQPGATVTVDASAVQALLDTITVSASLAGVTVDTEIAITVEEPAAGATFGISDTAGISWSQQAGTAPGSVVFTGTAPVSAS